MRSISMTLMLVALLVAGGCSDKGSVTVATDSPATTTESGKTAELTPEELGALGARIEKQPDQARSLLSESGLTEQSFEQAIRKVAEDPEASKRYAEAYKRARA